MNKLLQALPLLLMSGLGFAADMEEAVNSAPAETVSVVFVWLFLLAFIAMIVGFFVYMWWNEKNGKAGKVGE